ncbi:hypothetical protein QTP86_000844 [Hemibagrus guttatus]|nr:hypothetical protein QTP86_000844 [Hemibagrus guttatus]
MKGLGNITYPQVFDQKTATHVVTAVLYGAQVFMVFDYTKPENKNKQEIEGNLNAMVKKIPKLSLDGEASLKMNEDEKKLLRILASHFMNWSTFTFGKEISTGISRTKSSDIQSEVPHPVCNPTGPKLQTLHDIALYFKQGKDSVVFNSCRDGTWEHEEKAPGDPFVQGGAFDIIVVIKPECYEPWGSQSSDFCAGPKPG